MGERHEERRARRAQGTKSAGHEERRARRAQGTKGESTKSAGHERRRARRARGTKGAGHEKAPCNEGVDWSLTLGGCALRQSVPFGSSRLLEVRALRQFAPFGSSRLSEVRDFRKFATFGSSRLSEVRAFRKFAPFGSSRLSAVRAFSELCALRGYCVPNAPRARTTCDIPPATGLSRPEGIPRIADGETPAVQILVHEKLHQHEAGHETAHVRPYRDAA